MDGVNELTLIDPPHRLRWKPVNDSGPARTLRGNYLLEPENGGTAFTLHNAYESSPLMGPAAVNKWVTDRFVISRMLDRLQKAVAAA